MHFLHHFVLVLLLSLSAMAQLPTAYPEHPGNPLEADRIGLSEAWDHYIQRHPGTRVMDWDRFHPYPHRVFMSQSALAGGRVQSAEDLDSRLRAFLSKYPGLLCEPQQIDQLVPRQLARRGHVWYADYRMVVDGLQLYLAEVNFRVSEDGHLLMVGSDLPLEYETRAPVLGPAGIESACYSLPSERYAVESVELSEGKVLLPRFLKGGWVLEAASHALVRLDHPEQIWEVWVSAVDGSLLMSYNRVRHVEMTGRMMLECEHVQPSDAALPEALAFAYVNVGGSEVTTDADGYFTVNLNGDGPWPLSAELRGLYANANRMDASNASFNSQFTNDGDEFTITEDEAHLAELDGYASTVRVHEYIKAMDPGFTLLDTSLPVNVNINSTCNAYWDGASINFFREGGGCPNTAQVAGVLYHEYGHGVNDRVYQQAGVGGMENASLHEGLADATAVLQLDVDYVAPGWNIRNLNNSLHYPEDMQGECHADGRFMGGSIWDLRMLTGDIDLVSNLVHFARWGTADDPDLGRCYFEYFLEVLVVDDDDGDLGNLTPHFDQINEAFNNHGIGSDLCYLGAELEVVGGVPFFQDPMEDLPVELALDLPAFVAPTGVDLVWWTEDADTQRTACSLEDGNWLGLLPGQTIDTIVSLYIDVHNSIGQQICLPADAPESVYRIIFGYANGVLLDFEEADGDGEASGDWSWGVPQSGPWGAHSGDRVWATDLRGQYSDYSLSQLSFPPQVVADDGRALILFYHWYGIEEGWDGANCQISINANPWQDVTPLQGYDFVSPENNIWSFVPGFTGFNEGWERVVLDITTLVEEGDEVEVRFNLFTDANTTSPGWYLDDLQYLGFVTPPGIQHEPLCDSEDVTQTAFPIYATLQTSVPVDQFLLRYCIDDGEEQQLNMMPDSTQFLYRSEIPGPLLEQTVRYRLEATNSVGFFNSLPAGEGWFQFHVGADHQQPVPTFLAAPHDLIGHAGVYHILANAEDNLGIEQVWMEVSTDDANWENVGALEYLADQDCWGLDLQLDEQQASVLYYRLAARDQASLPNDGYSESLRVTLGQYQFVDNFPEYHTDKWMLGEGWSPQNMRVHEGDWALGTSEDGFYSVNANTVAELDYGFNLVGAPADVTLEMWECWFLEEDDDLVFIEVSTDEGEEWTTVATRTGGSIWSQNRISLSDFWGEADLRLRFRLISDGDTDGLNVGYFVDEICLLDGFVSVEEAPQIASDFRLGRPWPNPFNPRTHISFYLPQAQQVSARLYNIRGELVRELLHENMAAGSHDLVVDGSALASGVYLLGVSAGGETRVQRMLLLK